jgi:hypothetical protein
MTLSKKQLEDNPKIKYRKWFWIWERDLLALAGDIFDWHPTDYEVNQWSSMMDAYHNRPPTDWRTILDKDKCVTLWRQKAHELGFKDERIYALWPHADAGRHIKYMENPWWKEPANGNTDSATGKT